MAAKRRTVIITGAGSGIGRAVAQRAIANGDWVVGCDLNGEALDDLELGARVVGDITAADVQEEALTTALNAPGSTGVVDALFNICGITPPFGPTLEVSQESWDRTFAVNVGSMFGLCKLVGEQMIAVGQGAIVNTSSLAGLAGIPQAAAYVASKHAVVGLTRALAVEWAPYGVRVNALCPGLTVTEAARRAVEASTPGLFAERSRKVPIGKLASPDDQARVAMFLASEDAAHMTGVALVNDGGTLAQHPGYPAHSIQ